MDVFVLMSQREAAFIRTDESELKERLFAALEYIIELENEIDELNELVGALKQEVPQA